MLQDATSGKTTTTSPNGLAVLMRGKSTTCRSRFFLLPQRSPTFLAVIDRLIQKRPRR